MKKIYLGILLVLFLTGCTSEWLDNAQTGEILTQDEYENMTGTSEATVRGLYSLLYSMTDHDLFGQKSIDIATDLMSGDMAMTADAYGWYGDAEQGLCSHATSPRNEYIWSYYYTIIMNANYAIKTFVKKDTAGLLTYADMNGYAQSLTMRAYCYFNLAQLYSADYNTGLEDVDGNIGENYYCVPIYTENSFDESNGLMQQRDLSTAKDVYDQAKFDIIAALSWFDQAEQSAAELNADISRPSKLYVNKDIAHAYLAYIYLQTQQYDSAYKYAKKVIDEGEYHILPYENVLSTGFVSVEDPSWMWGLDVTIENTGGLGSFWGHMDIHTYSYAYAGATKAMDDVLYDQIPTNDIRKRWFDKSKKCIPDYKFYDLRRGVTADQIDRRWLNDVVFMRIEEMYLIAAEAAYRANKDEDAKEMLSTLLKERDEETAGKLDTYSHDVLGNMIYLNWRCEMWGEGRGLMTFKRFATEKVRGKNHFVGGGDKMNPLKIDEMYVFALPYGEYANNNEITVGKNNKE